MNYIVLDLEWNQSADGKAYTNSRIPFEIIQIGAVKLDENFSEISQFDRYIRPAVYTKLHDKVQEILNVTIEELTCIGHDFTDVANDFIRWCGDDYIFCTWGQTDLTELQRNFDYYNIEYNFPKPFRPDSQKIQPTGQPTCVLTQTVPPSRRLIYTAEAVKHDPRP